MLGQEVLEAKCQMGMKEPQGLLVLYFHVCFFFFFMYERRGWC